LASEKKEGKTWLRPNAVREALTPAGISRPSTCHHL
jgi:hypothetical protein